MYAWDYNGPSLLVTWNFTSRTLTSLFATSDGRVFASTFTSSNVSEILVWGSEETTRTIVMPTNKSCDGLFVVRTDWLYCSLSEAHSVLMLHLNTSSNTSSSIAGGSEAGNEAYLLNAPAGIFVTDDFKLYVADSGNDRIQRFLEGQLNATTVAGTGAPGTIALSHPRAVVLDAHEFMFIIDFTNNRLVGEGLYGFRCIAGCRNNNGSGSDTLNMPESLSFDSYGNLFVADSGNNRVLEFLLTATPCGKYC